MSTLVNMDVVLKTKHNKRTSLFNRVLSFKYVYLQEHTFVSARRQNYDVNRDMIDYRRSGINTDSFPYNFTTGISRRTVGHTLSAW